MKRKYKLIIISSLLALFFGAGITYSIFTSNASLISADQNIAKFIFNSQALTELDISLTDLKPGDTKIYNFSVSNNYMEKISNVSIQYQMIIKTYHFIPITIQLYKVFGEDNEQLAFTCDETYSRSSENELICNTPIFEMGYSSLNIDNYKIKIEFPSEYNTEEYSDLVDYINIEINSWQKLGD